MSDDTFQGFNRAGKAAQHGREKPRPPELTPMVKQIFFRLQDAGALTLTPQEKSALLSLYQKAYPAFYAREMEKAASTFSLRIMIRYAFRAVGWILTGILILSLFFQLI